jgi:methionyl-tRNA synthetase
MDEHGQKVETVATERGISPQAHVDYIAQETKALWKLLDIKYDDFIRTTETRHESVVEEIFEQLLKQGDIYLGHYEGYYCIHDESFFTETQLEEGHVCPDCGRKTKLVKEESYFLKLSKYQDWLLTFIHDNPNFIQPESRKNEVVRFIESGLQDLSVSRTSFDWGVKVKSDPKHVIYVWIDALSNYITSLGYKSSDDTLFEKYWNGDEVVHVVGKDILRFHAIYWPIMLKALGVDINFRLYAHGWYMMKDGKMSKSKGKVVYPNQLIERYGLDPVRYYLLREIPYSGDGVFTPEDFVARINYDLANDFGNLLNRTITMMNKYFDSSVTKPVKQYFDVDQDLQDKITETIELYESYMEKLDVSNAIKTVWSLVSRTNKYIDETMPWVLAKDDSKQADLNSVLYYLAESLRQIGILLEPILLVATTKLFDQLNVEADYQTYESLHFGAKDTYHVTDKPTPIFPRLDQKEEEAFIVDMINPPKPKDTPKKADENLVTIDDFAKLEFVVGEVLDCKMHPDADRLLVSQIDTGDRVRQIVSGISKFYSPTDMIGKKVVVVKNLKPVKLRGVLSEGMILAGKNKKHLEVLEVNALNKGDKIS